MRDKFWSFVVERERLRSERHTDDPRLSGWWFPNIRRTDDPTTVAWMDEYAPHLSGERFLVANIAYRLFSNRETAALIKPILLEWGWDSPQVLGNLGGRARLFNHRLGRALPSTLDRVCQIMERVQAAANLPFSINHNIENNVAALTKIRGIGPIVAYEVALDMHNQDRCEDAISWAAQTPPTVRGAGLVLGEELNPDTQEGRLRTLHLMRDLYAEAGHGWGWELSEMHRALALFYTYARLETPLWRYR